MSFYSSPTVREPITISGIFYYFNGIINSYLLPEPLKIYDNVNVTINLPEDGTFKSGEEFWRELKGNGKYYGHGSNLKTE